MTRERMQRLLLVIGVTMICAATMFAQTSNIFKIRISDNGAASDSGNYVFGNHMSATYGVNQALGENASPPDPPGYYSKWVNITGRSVATYSATGLLYKDLRDGPVSLPDPTRRDTFFLKIKNDNVSAVSADLTISWPNASYLGARCDSMYFLFTDPTLIGDPSGASGGGVPAVSGSNAKVDMFAQSSVTILTPFDPSGWNLAAPAITIKIYKKGVGTYIDAVKKQSNVVPLNFALHQNYPNPFNPTTNFEFEIRHQGVTDIAVYNMLGQKVSTLVSRELSPGTYSAAWNGKNDEGIAVTSGVYFVRMSVHTATGANEFAAVRKMLLMK